MSDQQTQQSMTAVPAISQQELRLKSLRREILQRLLTREREFDQESREAERILVGQHSVLEENNATLRAMRSILLKREAEVSGSLGEVKVICEKMRRRVANLEDVARSMDFDPEGTPVAPEDILRLAPAHREAIQRLASVAADDDAIFFAGKAAERERVGVDELLRTVRAVAREQFEVKAHARKAGLRVAEACRASIL